MSPLIIRYLFAKFNPYLTNTLSKFSNKEASLVISHFGTTIDSCKGFHGLLLSVDELFKEQW
jgi:hypothetical protein